MKSLREIMDVVADHKEELQRIYKVNGIFIFGSYARDEQKKTSDIDIIVEFEKEESMGGFEYIGLITDLEDYLHKILGIKPHIASKRHAMSSDKWKDIEKEAVCVFKDMNPAKKIKELIVKTLAQSGIYVKKIILFGSRARGNFHKYSDYDILIITERTFTVKEKMELSERIRDNLVRLNFPTDIIIKSEQEIAYYQDKIGSVVREALKEKE